jgi:cell division protein FtsB
MRDFKKRRTLGSEILRVFLGTLGVLALAALAFFAGRATWDMYGKFAAAASARADAEAELAELRGRQERIRTDVDALSSERGVEAAIRERYGVAKPGEGQIAIVRSATSSEPFKSETGVFEKLWRMLFVW